MRRSIVIIFGISALSAGLWLAWLRQQRPVSQEPGLTNDAIRSRGPTSSSPDRIGASLMHEQINVGSLSRAEIGAEVTSRDRLDPKWEWKVPIRFYGKVVDEVLLPI